MFSRYAEQLNPEQMHLLRKHISSLGMHPYLLSFFQGLVGAATINAIVAFGGELGWRGFLYKAFKPLGFWMSSLVIGLVWGIWHVPIVMLGHNYPQHPGMGIWMMFAWCLLASPLFQYIRMKSGSVVATALLQGAFTGASGLTMMLLKGGNDLSIGFTGAAGLIVLLGVNACLAFVMLKEEQPKLG